MSTKGWLQESVRRMKQLALLQLTCTLIFREQTVRELKFDGFKSYYVFGCTCP
jgi:hypothetical protein